MPKLSGEGGRGGDGRRRKRRKGGSGGAQHGAPGALRDQQTHGGTTTHTVPLSDGSGTYTPPKPAGWIIRRQKLLRQAGFNVSVDGVWGARSQGAWDRFNKRIGAANGLTGQEMVQRSQAAQRIARARRDASKAIAGAQAGAGAALGAGPPSAQHGAPVALGQSRRDYDANVGRYYAWQQGQQIIHRLTGTELHRGGQKVEGVRTLRQAAEQGRITADDLRFLGDHGQLRIDRPEDVRVAQITLNHLLGDRKVAVTGHWDVETASAMRDLIIREEKRKYQQSLRWAQRHLITTGLAQRVTRRLTGNPVNDAATLIGILSQDTPIARRIARNLANAYEKDQEDRRLLALKNERVEAIAGSGPGDDLFGGLYQPDASFVLAGGDGVDQILAGSRSLQQFANRMDSYKLHLIEQERKKREEEMKRAHADPGFWMSALGTAIDVVSWPGEKGAQWAVTWMDTSLSGQTGVHVNQGGGVFGGLLDFGAGAVYNRGEFGNPATNIDRNWHDARQTLNAMPWWERTIYESLFDPLNLVGTGIVTGIAKGTVRGGSVALARSGSFLLRDAEAASLGITSRRAISTSLYRAANRTHNFADAIDLSHPIRRTVGGALRTGFQGATSGPLGTIIRNELEHSAIYQMATTTRAAAVESALRTRRTLKVAVVRGLATNRVAHAVGSALAPLAARQDEIARILDPEMRRALETHAFHQRDAVSSLAPELVDTMGSWGTSLYGHYLRDGGDLSFAGTRVMARLSERARQNVIGRLLILEDLAKRGAPGNVSGLSIGQLRVYYEHKFGGGALDTLMAQAGSYKAGTVPYRFIEDFEREHGVAMQRIFDQLIPTLDDLVRDKVGDSIWHLNDEVASAVEETTADLSHLRETMWAEFLKSEADDGADEALDLADRLAAGGGRADGEAGATGVLLRGEADDDIRASLDEFFGYDVAKAYDTRNWIAFKNPNHGVRVSTRQRDWLIQAEQRRTQDSITRWAETIKRVGSITDPEQIARIDAAVLRRISTRNRFVEWAFKEHPKGGWVDTRDSLRAPAPTVGNVQNPGASKALEQLDRLADAVTDFDRSALPGQDLFLLDVEDDVIRSMVEGDGWKQYAIGSLEFERLALAADEKVAASIYYDNGLLLSALSAKQAIPYRVLYFFLSKMLWAWKTATLPFRPGFFVRNTVDNFIKAFVSGLRDPRLFFNPEGKSVFEVALVRDLLGAAGILDRIFGTQVKLTLGLVLDGFWKLDGEVIRKILGVHGVDVPLEVLDQLRTAKSVFDDAAPLGDDAARAEFGDQLADVDTKLRDKLANAPQQSKEWLQKFPDVMWELMAGRPEVYAKRILYVSKYRQVLRATGDEVEATKQAVLAVDRALFDYSKVTVLEDNLKVLTPFVFFWRKNADFWLYTLEEKPWFFVQGNRLYDEHQDGNADMPDWMRRYVSLAPVASITDAVPGLDWLSGWLRDGTNFDPLNYISISQFYTSFKNGNPDLPADEQGWRFLSGIVDGINFGAGLGFNPFLNDAGQRLGVLNRHNWQDIFPQTTLLQALTSKGFLRDLFRVDSPEGFNVEDFLLDPVFKLMGSTPGEDLTRDRFNELVQREMGEQRARGETVSRERAEGRVQSFYAFQTITGYAIGVFPKQISKESRVIYSTLDHMRDTYLDPNLTLEQAKEGTAAIWSEMTPDEQEAYRLFKARGYSPDAFDRYRLALDAARPYYEMDDYADKQAWLADHPEAAMIVHPDGTAKLTGEHYLQTQILLARTDAVADFANTFLKGIDAPGDVQNAAYGTLVTPSLRRFWRQNDTPQEIRNRQMRGSFFRYIDGVQSTYFTIPADDFTGKQQYLDRHPELLDYWRINDTATDDFRAIYRNANASFRSIYFHFVDDGDWDSAEEFLRRHPFIFDYTSAEGRVTGGGRLIPSSEHQGDYAQVADELRVYWSLPAKLRDGYGRSHPAVLTYIKKYGATDGLYAQAVEYDKLRDTLAAYFRLPVSLREAYLNRHPELRSYFARYSHDRTLSQHARDYLAVKGLLDQFFALPDSQRQAFLSRHPEVQAYFDKYGSKGKNAHDGGSFEGKLRVALAQNPEVASRYEFWQTFFALTPDRRPAFIHQHAEQAGVFIYGNLSYAQQQQQIARDHRMAVRLGLTDKQVLYRRVAPLLDLYFSLDEGSSERAIFLQTNPDLARYLDVYAKHPLIKDPKLRRLVERYFLLPAFGADRADFIDRHPEIGRYFNRDASPAEAAMQRQIDRFFKLPFGPQRDEYLAKHPELRHYFDQREREHSLFGDLAAAFNDADPRMDKFREMYADIVPTGALKAWMLERQGVKPITQAPSREDAGRAPDDAEAGTLTRRRARTGDVS